MTMTIKYTDLPLIIIIIIIIVIIIIKCFC